MRKYFTPRFLARAAIVAALYAAVTLAVSPIAYGPLQVRISEALCVLPFFTTAAIPGLFVGCLIANGLGALLGLGAGPADIVFGSLATLAAALLTRVMPNRYLAPLPPVIINAVVVGIILHAVLAFPLVPTMLWVGLGELIACYALGLPLMLVLEKHRDQLFSE